MKTTYNTVILGFGNHAAIEIPLENLDELGANKRAPLKITIGDYTYQSTATVMDGRCLVVFPTKDRLATGLSAGDKIKVTLELDSGYREVDVPDELLASLKSNGLASIFQDLTYSKRKEFARQVADAKTDETKERRIVKIMDELKNITESES